MVWVSVGQGSVSVSRAPAEQHGALGGGGVQKAGGSENTHPYGQFSACITLLLHLDAHPLLVRVQHIQERASYLFLPANV